MVGAYTKAIQMKQKVPQTKNTLDWRLAWSSSTIYGVEYAMAQFRSQFEAVAGIILA